MKEILKILVGNNNFIYIHETNVSDVSISRDGDLIHNKKYIYGFGEIDKFKINLKEYQLIYYSKNNSLLERLFKENFNLDVDVDDFLNAICAKSNIDINKMFIIAPKFLKN